MRIAFGLRALLISLLLWSVQSLAAEWIVASELTSTRRATEAEFKALQQQLRSKFISYNFESSDYLVHEGDLSIDGNFDCDVLLVVQGKLTVKGLYNDYRSNIGALVVQGDMAVDQLYSWGALYVQGDLNARGLVLTVYNDFTFEIGGKVNARALVISDKGNDYRAGKLEVELTDDSDSAQRLMALRQFVPELYAGVDHLELDEEFEQLRFDDSAAVKRLNAGLPVFREQVADAELGVRINRALSPELTVQEQIKLAGADLLLAQLIAARDDLSAAVAQTLVQRNDPTVNAWLAQSHPKLVQRQTQSLTPELAQRLAENPATPLETLKQLAAHSDPKVRSQLVEHNALPDQVEGRALMSRLLADPDPSVQAAVLSKFAHLSAFGWELSDDKLEALIKAGNPAVLDALANAYLSAKQSDELIKRLTPAGLNALANSLREQARRRRPTRLSAAQIDGLALRIIALPALKDTWSSFHSDAFLALSPALQTRQLAAGIERRVFDPDRIAEHTHSLAVMTELRDLSLQHSQVILPKLASNRLLPEAIQLQIVAAASQAPDPDSGAWETMETLLENDDAAPAAIIAAADLAVAGLWLAGSGPIFHHGKLPAEAINKIDARYAANEDWALTLMSQPNATVAQRVKALKRWYDNDAAVQASLAGAESLDPQAFYQRLAQSPSEALQEQALGNTNLPLNLVELLQKSPFERIAQAAKLHPSIALDDLPLALLDSESTLRYLPRANPQDWLSLSQRLPSLQLRAIAHQRYGEATLRAQ